MVLMLNEAIKAICEFLMKLFETQREPIFSKILLNYKTWTSTALNNYQNA